MYSFTAEGWSEKASVDNPKPWVRQIQIWSLRLKQSFENYYLAKLEVEVQLVEYNSMFMIIASIYTYAYRKWLLLIYYNKVWMLWRFMMNISCPQPPKIKHNNNRITNVILFVEEVEK